MNIVFVNSSWPQSWGGGEKWTVEAAQWFQQRGDEICVIGRPRSKLIAAAQGRNLKTIEYRFGGDFDPLAILKARKLLHEANAELAVVNFNKEAWQFGLASKRLKIPIIARHGFPLLRDTVHHRRLVQNVLTRLIVNARSIKDNYAHLGFDVSRVKVIHNGVQFLTQRQGELRRRFNIQPDEILILAAGRIESQKRFDRVIEIARVRVPVHPKLRFLIAGEGPMRESLEAEIRTHDLSDHVSFTGFIPDLAEIIGDADLFLLTSDDEGTPNVLLEAMAAGVPSLAFAVGAVPDIMTETLSSNCVAAGDVPAMAIRVRDLIEHPDWRKSTASGMRKRIQDNFTFEHSMQQYSEQFDQVLQERK